MDKFQGKVTKGVLDSLGITPSRLSLAGRILRILENDERFRTPWNVGYGVQTSGDDFIMPREEHPCLEIQAHLRTDFKSLRDAKDYFSKRNVHFSRAKFGNEEGVSDYEFASIGNIAVYLELTYIARKSKKQDSSAE